jgi:hypothetical protein
MGDMTAATLIAPLRSTCARCGLGAAAGTRFCSACGTAIAADRAVAPHDLAARRTVQLGALTIIANIVVGAAGFGVVYMMSDAPRLLLAATVLEALQMVIVGTLAASTLRFGVRAVRLTRDGRTRVSPWSILGIIVAIAVLLSTIGSFVVMALLSLGLL